MGIRFGPVKVSSRGVRVRVGPRIARVHVGSGRPGISTGIGPFGAYAPIGSRRRKRGGRRSRGGGQAAPGIACPYCGAAPGQWCVTASGSYATRLHADRTQLTAAPRPMPGYEHYLQSQFPGPGQRSAGQPPVHPAFPKPSPSQAGTPPPVQARRRPPVRQPQVVQARWPRTWPGWTLLAGIAGLVAGVTLSVIGGSNSHDAAASASGAVTLVALLALCVAVPAALYRRHRTRRIARTAQPDNNGLVYSPSEFATAQNTYAASGPCSRCGRPAGEHSGASLTCPQAPGS
jgi:hypothetical protein